MNGTASSPTPAVSRTRGLEDVHNRAAAERAGFERAPARAVLVSDSLRARLVRAADSLRAMGIRVPMQAPRLVYGLPRDDSLYITVTSATPVAYEFVIGAAEDCDGGNWCRIGTVTGRRLRTPRPLPAGRRITLANERVAVFEDASCGANCSDATMTWDQDGVRYSVGKKAGTLERLRAMAESATRLP